MDKSDSISLFKGISEESFICCMNIADFRIFAGAFKYYRFTSKELWLYRQAENISTVEIIDV